MGRKPLLPQTEELLRPRLDELLKMSHPLFRISRLIQWQIIDRQFSTHPPSTVGRPALPSRMIAGLLYLQHANATSDETVVATWLENPYW